MDCSVATYKISMRKYDSVVWLIYCKSPAHQFRFVMVLVPESIRVSIYSKMRNQLQSKHCMILNKPTIFATTSTITISYVSDAASCVEHST
jgi:hypothetical protein